MKNQKNNLYEVLGIDKTSDTQIIKNGYRRMAKKKHPDKGGSPEAFALVKHAHDILMDDERRKKYDTTGDEAEESPDNAKSTAINLIAAFFGGILQECASAGKSPLEIDIINKIKSKISAGMEEPKKQIRILNGVLAVDKKMVGRFKNKKKDTQNIFDAIVKNRIDAVNMNIKNLEDQINVGELALSILNDVSYKFDQPEVSAAAAPMWVSIGSF